MTKKILTNYVVWVYIFLFLELAGSMIVSQKVLTPNPELENKFRKIVPVFFILGIGLAIYMFVTSKFSLRLKRIASVLFALGIFGSLHFLLKRTQLTQKEKTQLIYKFAGAFVLMTGLGMFLAKNYSDKKYIETTFGFIVAILVGIGFMLLDTMISKGKDKDSTRMHLYIGLAIMMGALSLNTWGLFTKYRDPSPFYASLDVYYDTVAMLKYLIRLED